MLAYYICNGEAARLAVFAAVREEDYQANVKSKKGEFSLEVNIERVIV